MTTTIRSSEDGSKSYIAVGGTDRVTIDAATGKLTSTYSPPTGERSLALATMQKFADEFGASLASSGYQKLPSGLIIQWGYVASGTTITFPIAFPNACLQVIPQCQYNNAAAYSAYQVYVSSKTTTNFTMPSAIATLWFAIGY